jgi:hypothetical protein
MPAAGIDAFDSKQQLHYGKLCFVMQVVRLNIFTLKLLLLW